jgi:hypothetical protein
MYEEDLKEIKNQYQVKYADPKRPGSAKRLDRVAEFCKKSYKSTFFYGIDCCRSSTLHFWIDTLCIPLDVDYRRKAIENMDKIYGAAMHTVVLDS